LRSCRSRSSEMEAVGLIVLLIVILAVFFAIARDAGERH
jgi:hypothetical protein